MTADKIKMLREQMGMDQAALARQLELTRSSINSWESGYSTPSSANLVQLAQIFNVSTDFLLDVENTSAMSLKGLSDEDVKILVHLAEHLRKKNKCD